MAAFHLKLAGKVVVVTGASSGLGRGIAVALAQKGASLFLTARRSALLKELADSDRIIAIEGDVSDQAHVKALAEVTIKRFGRIDVWINNAGVGVIGAFSDVPLQDHAQVIQTNLLGTLYGSHAAMTQFCIQKTAFSSTSLRNWETSPHRTMHLTTHRSMG